MTNPMSRLELSIHSRRTTTLVGHKPQRTYCTIPCAVDCATNVRHTGKTTHTIENVREKCSVPLLLVQRHKTRLFFHYGISKVRYLRVGIRNAVARARDGAHHRQTIVCFLVRDKPLRRGRNKS